MTQLAKLLNWLESHDGVTTAEATTGLKCYRLSERIRELETLGYHISHTPETTDSGARVIRYRLMSSAPQRPTAAAKTAPSNEGVGHGAVAAAEPYMLHGKRVVTVAEYKTCYATIEVVRDA